MTKRLVYVSIPPLLGTLIGLACGNHGVLLGSLAALVIVPLATFIANVASRNTSSLAGLGAGLALATVVRLAGFFLVFTCTHAQSYGRSLIATLGMLLILSGFLEQTLRQFSGNRPGNSSVPSRGVADA